MFKGIEKVWEKGIKFGKHFCCTKDLPEKDFRLLSENKTMALKLYQQARLDFVQYPLCLAISKYEF